MTNKEIILNDSISRKAAVAAIENVPRWIMDPAGGFQLVDPLTVAVINPEDAINAITELQPAQPKPCPYCGGNAIRKQCHFKVGKGESRYKNEHHEDGSLKWTWLECDSCGRATEAYCYEYQATDYWNKGKAERRTDDE